MPRIEAVSIVVRESCGYMSKKITLIVRGHIRDHRKRSQRRVIDQYQVNTHQYSEENEERFKFILNSVRFRFHQDASTTSGVLEVARHLYANRSIRRCSTSSPGNQHIVRRQPNRHSEDIKTKSSHVQSRQDIGR
ncbi:hypothetical protein CAEBREN_10003 [Caenorhabditis brenneri]|uniref:Uncharacterized protein n=1 Tax=Caenorhabditis brenneri TaxID=135651 RepID=G0NWG6_CAEBE|nr:hypothetical protein CAEBREN_10003 [Caenorhabditis brenneri]